MLELVGWVFVLSLATWRLTHLLYDEDGPWCIFRKLRKSLGILHDKDGRPAGYPETFWGDTFGCFWCLSIWVALPLVIVTALTAQFDVWQAFLLWAASSAGAIRMNEGLFRSLRDG